jgi:hypothetical protein
VKAFDVKALDLMLIFVWSLLVVKKLSFVFYLRFSSGAQFGASCSVCCFSLSCGFSDLNPARNKFQPKLPFSKIKLRFKK